MTANTNQPETDAAEIRRIFSTEYKGPVVTTEEELEDGKLRMARFKHQAAQLAKAHKKPE